MHRSFYKLAIFITTLLTLSGLYYGFTYFTIGPKVFELQYFSKWILTVGLFDLVGVAIFLKYYHLKKFKSAFSMEIVAGITQFLQFFAGYGWVMKMELGMNPKYTYLALLFVLVVYGYVLISSNANTRPYLKKAGIVLCTFIPFVIVCYIIAITSTNSAILTTLDFVFRWIELIGSFIPILFILNFVDELRTIPKSDIRPASAGM